MCEMACLDDSYITISTSIQGNLSPKMKKYVIFTYSVTNP